MELLTDKVIYHVETQEDYDDLMEKLEELGYKWGGTKNVTNLRAIWGVFKDESHIRLYPDKTLNCIDSHTATTYLSEYKIIKYKKEQNSMKVKLKSNEKFTADWYEANKDDLEHEIGQAYHEIGKIVDKDYQAVPEDIFLYWLGETKENPIRTLINMQQFGYEIEQLYTVELPNPNSPMPKIKTMLSKRKKWCRNCRCLL